MHLYIFLSWTALLMSSFITSAHAKCCRPDSGGDCGDNSAGTSCCSYKKCNGFCCACEGVQIIRQEVDVDDGGSHHHSKISAMTAPYPTTVTCRDDHITKNPFTTKEVREVTITAAPEPYTGIRPPGRQAPSECENIFYRVSKGSGEIVINQYLSYFDFAAIDDPSDDCPRKAAVVDASIATKMAMES